jgi:response regulator RpfG family c-di-GMP phosphodiesterase
MIRVILLEDKLPDQILFETVLQDLDFSGEFYLATNVKELISILNEVQTVTSGKDLNILFLEMVLPGIMGTDFICKLEFGKLKGANFCFFLSGLASESIINKAYQQGINSYIIKPKIYTEFFSVIQTILSFCKRCSKFKLPPHLKLAEGFFVV